MNDYSHIGKMVRARFVPKRVDDLRPEAREWIGKLLVWRCEDRGGPDDPYPGQTRWWPLADDESPSRCGAVRKDAYWVPEEDLEIEEWLTPKPPEERR